jgi:hypothetical protein
LLTPIIALSDVVICALRAGWSRLERLLGSRGHLDAGIRAIGTFVALHAIGGKHRGSHWRLTVAFLWIAAQHPVMLISKRWFLDSGREIIKTSSSEGDGTLHPARAPI